MRHGHAGARLTAQDLKRAQAEALDAADPLAGFAQEFYHPHDLQGRKLLYFGGHSLGLQPKSAAAMVEQELQDWRRLGVLGHTAAARPWIPYHERAAPALADLAGATQGEVVAMNSLTVNLHLMMVSFFRPDTTRNSVLIESSAFPSDRYAVVSQLEFHGLTPEQNLIEIRPRPGERTLRTEDMIERIEREGSRLNLVLLPGVQYLTGQLLDMPALIAAARRVGAHVGVDLAHAIGNTPLQLHDWNPDFAVWCCYKYLNAGPGAVGGCFVHDEHGRDLLRPRLAGWWGNDPATRFHMHTQTTFTASAGAGGWQISNPPILAMAPLLASLALFDEAGMPALRAKSERLTGYLHYLLTRLPSGHFDILTPSDPARRGCQLSLRLRDRPRELLSALQAEGVVCDFREPDVLRIAPVPLYNTFGEVWTFARVLEQTLT